MDIIDMNNIDIDDDEKTDYDIKSNTDESSSYWINRFENNMKMDEINIIKSKMIIKSKKIIWKLDKNLILSKIECKTKIDAMSVINIYAFKTKFKLEFCFNGWNSSHRGFTAFYICTKNNDLLGKFSVELNLNNGINNMIRESSVRKLNMGMGFPNFILKNNLVDFLETNNEISVILTIYIYKENTIYNNNNLEINILKTNKYIYKNRPYADLIIKSSDYITKVNKVYFYHLDEYFKLKKNFQNNGLDSCENEINNVDLSWCSGETIAKFIWYAYNGDINMDNISHLENDFILEKFDNKKKDINIINYLFELVDIFSMFLMEDALDKCFDKLLDSIDFDDINIKKNIENIVHYLSRYKGFKHIIRLTNKINEIRPALLINVFHIIYKIKNYELIKFLTE
jgi:hypothetical protein